MRWPVVLCLILASFATTTVCESLRDKRTISCLKSIVLCALTGDRLTPVSTPVSLQPLTPVHAHLRAPGIKLFKSNVNDGAAVDLIKSGIISETPRTFDEINFLADKLRHGGDLVQWEYKSPVMFQETPNHVRLPIPCKHHQFKPIPHVKPSVTVKEDSGKGKVSKKPCINYEVDDSRLDMKYPSSLEVVKIQRPTKIETPALSVLPAIQPVSFPPKLETHKKEPCAHKPSLTSSKLELSGIPPPPYLPSLPLLPLVPNPIPALVDLSPRPIFTKSEVKVKPINGYSYLQLNKDGSSYHYTGTEDQVNNIRPAVSSGSVKVNAFPNKNTFSYKQINNNGSVTTFNGDGKHGTYFKAPMFPVGLPLFSQPTISEFAMPQIPLPQLPVPPLSYISKSNVPIRVEIPITSPFKGFSSIPPPPGLAALEFPRKIHGDVHVNEIHDVKKPSHKQFKDIVGEVPRPALVQVPVEVQLPKAPVLPTVGMSLPKLSGQSGYTFHQINADGSVSTFTNTPSKTKEENNAVSAQKANPLLKPAGPFVNTVQYISPAVYPEFENKFAEVSFDNKDFAGYKIPEAPILPGQNFGFTHEKSGQNRFSSTDSPLANSDQKKISVEIKPIVFTTPKPFLEVPVVSPPPLPQVEIKSGVVKINRVNSQNDRVVMIGNKHAIGHVGQDKLQVHNVNVGSSTTASVKDAKVSKPQVGGLSYHLIHSDGTVSSFGGATSGHPSQSIVGSGKPLGEVKVTHEPSNGYSYTLIGSQNTDISSINGGSAVSVTSIPKIESNPQVTPTHKIENLPFVPAAPLSHGKVTKNGGFSYQQVQSQPIIHSTTITKAPCSSHLPAKAPCKPTSQSPVVEPSENFNFQSTTPSSVNVKPTNGGFSFSYGTGYASTEVNDSFANNPIVVPDEGPYSYSQTSAEGSSMRYDGDKSRVSVTGNKPVFVRTNSRKMNRGDIPE